MEKNDSQHALESAVKEVSAIVSKMAGIQLGAKQFSMVENRLRTRMVRLGIKSFEDYLQFLKSHQESESQALLSLMTTHHTFFFREFSHFEYLLNKGLPAVVEEARANKRKTIRVWSAACSRGQEVYSLAMFLNFHLKDMAPEMDFEITGTDIDPESLSHAKNGVYRADDLKQAPAMYVQDNWIRGTGQVRDFSKVKDHLRMKCKFQTVNVLEPGSFLTNQKFDFIFCRNVFIYFNQDQILKCTQQFIDHLTPQGHLFVGVSESLQGLKLPVWSPSPSVYQKIEAKKKDPTSLTTTKPLVTTPTLPSPIQVLCVDDSPVILSLLKKILVPAEGFQVKATASNGKEALEMVKSQKFDIITLDLHMPEIDGLGFLEQSQSLNRPPAIIVSAINRDDQSIAQKALKLGAADYVEKPSLENISQAGNEIRSKLKTVLTASLKATANSQANGKATTTSAVTSLKTVLATSSLKPSHTTATQLSSKKKVLVVDDSTTIRNLLKKIINQDPHLEVVAEAEKPSLVEGLIEKFKPDVITLDIHMPEMDGITLLKKIHPKYQLPVVMISSISREEGPQVLQALESGAIDYIQKPSMSDLAEVAQIIREKIKIASQAHIRTIKRTRKKVMSGGKADAQSIIAIGSSTGGTEALRVVLESLPSEIPPILIVQHIPPVFSTAFAKRLNELCAFEVREANHGDEVKPNLVLIAPGGKQMSVKPAAGGKLTVDISDAPPMNRHKPSVDFLFKSIADIQWPKVTAAILTGMGADGAAQMKRLRDLGARTIAQDEETCVVFGMPREAIEKGAAEYIKPLDDIADALLRLATKPSQQAS